MPSQEKTLLIYKGELFIAMLTTKSDDFDRLLFAKNISVTDQTNVSDILHTILKEQKDDREKSIKEAFLVKGFSVIRDQEAND